MEGRILIEFEKVGENELHEEIVATVEASIRDVNFQEKCIIMQIITDDVLKLEDPERIMIASCVAGITPWCQDIKENTVSRVDMLSEALDQLRMMKEMRSQDD